MQIWFYELFNLFRDCCSSIWIEAGINPYPAELLQLYFSSFEAGIANAISPASNDEKYYYLWKKYMAKIKLLDQLSIY